MYCRDWMSNWLYWAGTVDASDPERSVRYYYTSIGPKINRLMKWTYKLIVLPYSEWSSRCQGQQQYFENFVGSLNMKPILLESCWKETRLCMLLWRWSRQKLCATWPSPEVYVLVARSYEIKAFFVGNRKYSMFADGCCWLPSSRLHTLTTLLIASPKCHIFQGFQHSLITQRPSRTPKTFFKTNSTTAFSLNHEFPSLKCYDFIPLPPPPTLLSMLEFPSIQDCAILPLPLATAAPSVSPLTQLEQCLAQWVRNHRNNRRSRIIILLFSIAL